MAALNAIAWFLNLMPLRVQWWLGLFFAWLWWDVFKLRRFTVYRNISIVFPKMPKAEKKKLIKKSLAWMGFQIIETLQLPQVDESWLGRRLIVEGLDRYQAAAGQGKGVLLLSLHLGNGDWGAAALPLAGVPTHLISKKFKLKRMNALWFGMREAKGTKFIDPHGAETAFQILKALKAKNAVIFVIDQFMGKPFGIETTFFGKKTGTAYGLALFATKTKAPVLPVYTYHDDEFRLHVVFGEEVPYQEFSSDKDLQMAGMTQKYNSVLEQIILRHPEHWMWVHRRWKKWE